jgi:hypothetical protein
MVAVILIYNFLFLSERINNTFGIKEKMGSEKYMGIQVIQIKGGKACDINHLDHNDFHNRNYEVKN